MAVAAFPRPRASVDGKFFRLGDEKFYVQGLAYGPFAPGATGRPFASPDQTAHDFVQIRGLGANLVRVYEVPDIWWLDLAARHDLKVMVDIPWDQHTCFLDSPSRRAEAGRAVREAVRTCAGHPAVFAFSVANEISPDIVRWSGAQAVADFIDELIQEARRVDPTCLCTFTNYPPTEFLRPQAPDFHCFNVYLHEPVAYRNYLARLQLLADGKPLLLGEFGMDSLREGEPRKAAFLEWQIEAAFRAGLAGAIVFSFTDDWWRGGEAVTGWQMGITTVDRQPKESCAAVRRGFRAAPHFPLPRTPRVSVVVATYNGDRTLRACLDSLGRLHYPDYEIIVVDDGSTDSTRSIAGLYSQVRYLRHEQNLGLSAARNTGITAASGEIVAFTDSDCRADEDWLYYLVGDLLTSENAGIGGPNLLPPEDSRVAAAVMASPGGPAHVMLTDQQAEHLPGCNMAFYKRVLVEIGEFDPIFRQAGDDVDVCWRLLQAGHKLGFSPAGFVWHFRRSTVRDYLRQQHGYGQAEARLVRKHPECFNFFGGSIWRGRIYTTARFGVLLRPAIIYRGLFGSGGFQSLDPATPAVSLMLCTTLEYHVLVTLPLWVFTAAFPHLLPLPIASMVLSLAVCAAAGAQAIIPRAKLGWWSRPLVALLFFLQPIVRGWARYQQRLSPQPTPEVARQTLDSLTLRDSGRPLGIAEYWTERRVDRLALVGDLLQQLDRQGWPHRADSGWDDYDVEIYDTRWTKLQLTTVTEEQATGQLIRCRLRPRWSLKARVAFWSLCGVELLVLGGLHHGPSALWLILAAIPLLAWFLRSQERSLQSLVRVLLDNQAKAWQLTPVDQAPKRPLAAAPTPPQPIRPAEATPFGSK